MRLIVLYNYASIGELSLCFVGFECPLCDQTRVAQSASPGADVGICMRLGAITLRFEAFLEPFYQGNGPVNMQHRRRAARAQRRARPRSSAALTQAVRTIV